ncbi:NADH-quinone oxidoreductase subunit NuoE [Thalassotalea mangrovi]|uniref:NADH-quinone oxidoreductase subunit E n=1 Tax=Thalassotalea mangrovi TaxID=2572245 RepID=A0A4U1B214_9GAMM|nr:NADH-quinone oxidoreductase subunit NuoE [Thalassotalea mangrovi]TKB43472.1 NADH-quinone oxidoreductase subunit NuoE [Thalassotalea mangrovi]
MNLVQLSYRDYLSVEEINAIEHEVAILGQRQAAGIEAMKLVQKNRGWISDDCLYAVADLLQMPASQLEGIATFYNLIYRQPVGRYVIHLCDSISCHLTGFAQVSEAIKEYLGIDYGETTSDGMFTLLTNACLGSCDKAPAMMIGEDHFEHLTPQSATDILRQLCAENDKDELNLRE